jgi:hypothetical protein
MNDPQDSADADRLKTDVAARLRPVCPGLSEEDFETLVNDIARMAARFRQIEADPALWRTVDQAERPLAPFPPE